VIENVEELGSELGGEPFLELPTFGDSGRSCPAQAPFFPLKEICSLAVFGTPVQSEKQSTTTLNAHGRMIFP
jgi:hypothetical protein